MLKGVGRQMIVVRDVGNDLFEQAIFIVNPGKRTDGMTQDDMAFAAKQIVSDYIKNYAGSGRVFPSRRVTKVTGYRFWLYGAGVAAVAAAVTAFACLF